MDRSSLPLSLRNNTRPHGSRRGRTVDPPALSYPPMAALSTASPTTSRNPVVGTQEWIGNPLRTRPSRDADDKAVAIPVVTPEATEAGGEDKTLPTSVDKRALPEDVPANDLDDQTNFLPTRQVIVV